MKSRSCGVQKSYTRTDLLTCCQEVYYFKLFLMLKEKTWKFQVTMLLPRLPFCWETIFSVIWYHLSKEFQYFLILNIVFRIFFPPPFPISFPKFLKELSLCHKLGFSNPYIIGTQCRKPLIFQTYRLFNLIELIVWNI